MKRFGPLATLIGILFTIGATQLAQAQEAYVLRDTTSLPAPAKGKARLLVSRERLLDQGLKPEFVFLDGKPFGMLPPRTASTGEVAPGWHRVWLGRGASAEAWFYAEAGGRYLVRLREEAIDGTWRSDMIRDSRDGYLELTQAKGMKLAVTTESGYATIQRNLKKLKPNAKADSTARAKALAAARLPIVIKGAWYDDLVNPAQVPAAWELHGGTLTVDAKNVTFVRHDTTVVTIPRKSITLLRYGGIRSHRVNPWLYVYYKVDGSQHGAAFVDPASGKGTPSYNHLFTELEKTGELH